MSDQLADGLTNDEPQIIGINLDAYRGAVEIAVVMPNVVALATECMALLDANEAKNYVQFDMIPRAELGVQGYRVTVQRAEGESPAQRVIEMEKQASALQQEVEQLRAQVAQLQAEGLTNAYSPGRADEWSARQGEIAQLRTEREHIDDKPDQVRWTDEEIRNAFLEMQKRTQTHFQALYAVCLMMRDSYEITRQAANRYIDKLEAQP